MADSKGQSLRKTTSGHSQKLSDAQRKEISSRLAALASATGETITPDRSDIYLQSLEDLPYEGLLGAISGMLLESRWFPKIPEIREAVLGKQPDAKAIAVAEAEASWLRVLEYANKWHPDVGPLGGSPKLTVREHRALQIAGGTERLWEVQDSGERDVDFIHRKFLEAYGNMDAIEGAMLHLEQPRRNKELPAGGFESFKDIIGRKQ